LERVLFVCTGNTCRSPMAELLAKRKMADFENLSFSSAGISARDGQPASPLAISVLSEMGIDLSSHRASRLTRDKITNSGLIAAMTPLHKSAVLDIDPEAEPKVIVLGELDGRRKTADIIDPIGRGREAYIGVRDEIDHLTDILKDYITERFNLGGDMPD